MSRSVKDLRELVCMSRLSMRDSADDEDPDSGRVSRTSIAPTPVPDEGHLDNMLQYADATIISEYLERTFGVSESLCSWWNTDTHSVQFTEFWLHELKEESRNGLLHLECGIVKEQLSLAFTVGKESGRVTSEDMDVFFKSVLREYPRRLCTAQSGQYRLLDILYCVCSSDRDDSYRKLLTDVRCSTSNRQFAHWVLASRAFAIVSLCDSIVRFFCESSPSVLVRPRTAAGRRTKSPPLVSSVRPCTPSDAAGNRRSYTGSGILCEDETRTTSVYFDDDSKVYCRPSSSLSIASGAATSGHTQKSVVTDLQRAFQCTRLGCVETLTYLLKRKRIDAAATDEQHRTLLVASVVYGQQRVLAYLLTLADGPSVNQLASSGNMPLHIAARQGSVDMVQDLILAGAQIDCWNSEADGATPLHFAVMHGIALMLVYVTAALRVHFYSIFANLFVLCVLCVCRRVCLSTCLIQSALVP